MNVTIAMVTRKDTKEQFSFLEFNFKGPSQVSKDEILIYSGCGVLKLSFIDEFHNDLASCSYQCHARYCVSSDKAKSILLSFNDWNVSSCNFLFKK